MKRLVVVLTVWAMGLAWVLTSVLLPAGSASAMPAPEPAVAVAVTNTATAAGGLPSVPVAAVTLSNGGSNTCTVTTVGGIKCWGINHFGQLGDGQISDISSVPVDVVGLASGAAMVSTGAINSCALTLAGAVKCWGYNAYGQLGDDTTTHSSVPVDVVGLGSGALAVSVGRMHSCALTSAGAVKCWGWNPYGQLGDGTTTNSSVPVSVAGLESGVLAVSAGADYTCALTVGGAVKCWGQNVYGELGDGTTTNSSVPVDLVGLGSGAVSVSAGWVHTCATTSAGAVRCWGFNHDGRLGNGTTTNSSVPVDVVGLGSGVVAVSAGSSTCALTTAGEAKCWGQNAHGELGDGTKTNSAVPVDVVDMGPATIAVVQGDAVTCAMASAGVAKCWGDNTYGQLGTGTTTGSKVPVDVVGLATPTTPTGAAATAGNAQAVVSWNASAQDGGSAITGYTITATPGGKSVTTTGPTTATITGLTNGAAYTFRVTATNASGTSPASLATTAVRPHSVDIGFTVITPKRVMDTRSGMGVPKARVGAGGQVTVTIPGIPSGTTAVALNVTVTNPSAASFLTVYPSGTIRPTTSNMNYVKTETIANQVIAKVGVGNKVTFFNSSGTVDVVADLAGYHAPGSGDWYNAGSLSRVLDTRSGVGGAQAKVGAGQRVTLALPGLPSGTTAVALNVTVTNPTAASFLSVYPADGVWGPGTTPTTSSMNFVKAQTIANLVIVKVAAGNKVTFFNNSGTVNIVADFAGYYATGSGAGYTAESPSRMLDTRSGVGVVKAMVGAGGEVTLTMPGIPAGATAVALNVTATNPSAASFLTLYPTGTVRPTVSNVNFVKAQTIANLVIAKVGPGNQVTFFNNAGTVDIVADLAGYYVP